MSLSKMTCTTISLVVRHGTNLNIQALLHHSNRLGSYTAKYRLHEAVDTTCLNQMSLILAITLVTLSRSLLKYQKYIHMSESIFI